MASPLHLRVAPGDDAPIYRQIVRQVREAIAAGRLAPGDRMPSHRALAEQLVVSPLTVKKAYDLLERDGLIETARGTGTFVKDGVVAKPARTRREDLRAAVRRLVHEAHLSGVDVERLLAMVADEAARLDAEQRKTDKEKSS